MKKLSVPKCLSLKLVNNSDLQELDGNSIESLELIQTPIIKASLPCLKDYIIDNKMLSNDCKDLNGTWVDAVWTDNDHNGYHDITGDTLLLKFYANTGANTLWGYCKDSSK